MVFSLLVDYFCSFKTLKFIIHIVLSECKFYHFLNMFFVSSKFFFVKSKIELQRKLGKCYKLNK